MPKNCSVPQCNNNNKKGNARHYHVFPKNTTLRKKWMCRLKMGKQPTKYQVVCSEHFKKSDYFISDNGMGERQNVGFSILSVYYNIISFLVFKCLKELLKPKSVPSEKLPKTSLELSGVTKTKEIKTRSKRLDKQSNISSNVEVATNKLVDSQTDVLMTDKSDDEAASVKSMDSQSDACTTNFGEAENACIEEITPDQLREMYVNSKAAM